MFLTFSGKNRISLIMLLAFHCLEVSAHIEKLMFIGCNAALVGAAHAHFQKSCCGLH